MFAITATAIDRDDPLSGLQLGEHPDPQPPDGWVIVNVRAASLNHHDLWTLRGVGIDEERLPIVLGCDAAGVTNDGQEVVVHSVIATAEDDETLADDFNILSEVHDGTFADMVAVPQRNLVSKPEDLSYEEAACLPTAYLTAYRMLFTRGEVKPGMRVLIQGAGEVSPPRHSCWHAPPEPTSRSRHAVRTSSNTPSSWARTKGCCRANGYLDASMSCSRRWVRRRGAIRCVPS